MIHNAFTVTFSTNRELDPREWDDILSAVLAQVDEPVTAEESIPLSEYSELHTSHAYATRPHGPDNEPDAKGVTCESCGVHYSFLTQAGINASQVHYCA
jgi:hypothetical protein